MNVLIIYGTTEGQTHKIAVFLKDEIENLRHQAFLFDANGIPPPPDGYDLVLIGASVHMHKYQPAVLHYVKMHVAALNKIRSGFFSVSMAAASEDDESKEELEEVTSGFLHETGWYPVHIEQAAGALLYTHYDFFKRLVMRLISKKHGRSTDTSGDHEYTDWAKLKVFLENMLKQ